MKFALKTDNYKTFKIYKDNVLQPRAYFIPFNREQEIEKTDIRNERYSSSMVQVLSGDWGFKYYKNRNDMPDVIDTDFFEFDSITVPSTWQHTGYEKPYYVNTRYQFNPNPPYFPDNCPVGIYYKCVEIDDASANYILTFLGVAGAFDVFVNGKYAGYSEGSHNTSEFEINEFINVGKNEIIVVNHKWSNGTYLECQDMFRCNGIFRDVLLTKTGDNSIYDFCVKTDYNSDGTYDLNIFPSLKLTDECELSAAVVRGGECIASKSVNVSNESVEKIAFSSVSVKEWSAENPNLYNLVLTLSKQGEIIEIIRRSIGFKHIRIDSNVFKFNNENIKLLGVNHHDTNPKTGYVMSVEDMEKDVRIFKEYNVNCVRTSHYPPDAVFLDLCDEYGIYVVDEADIETHGCEVELHKPGACSHNPEWKNHYWDRVYRMYERDKNHPSITMWSLGNEAHGYFNQDYCYEQLKKLTDIPVHYEGVCRTRRWAYDVVSQMYPWLSRVKKIAEGKGLPKKYYTKPYYMCEYAHAMGLGAGELETYVNYIYQGDNMLGGCIWEFADHAVYHENGEYKYTYGGDHGEWKHDGNFCVDGLFYPDRTPHAGALQMKNCYRPVRAEIFGIDESNKKATFVFSSHKYFENSNYNVKWNSIDCFGNTLLSGEFEIDIVPQGEQNISVVIGDAAENVILRYYDGDFEVACEQISPYIGGAKSVMVMSSSEDKVPVVNESEKKLYIRFENGKLVYNTQTGAFESYEKNGNEFINSSPFGNFTGFAASVFRAPIDNDMYLKNKWKKYKLETENFCLCKNNNKKAYSIEDGAVIIENDYKIITLSTKNLCKIRIKYSIFGDGSIKIDVHCLSSKMIMYAPRFGLVLEMPEKYDNVKYFGLGDRQNTSDFKEHALLGIYECKVDDMREKYIKPQESSMRTDVRFAEITDNDGAGLRFLALKDNFTFSADHFTSQQCAKAAHQEDLKICDTTCLHIDSYMLGAGSNACGSVPLKEHRVNRLKGQKLSILVMPLKNGE